MNKRLTFFKFLTEAKNHKLLTQAAHLSVTDEKIISNIKKDLNKKIWKDIQQDIEGLELFSLGNARRANKEILRGTFGFTEEEVIAKVEKIFKNYVKNHKILDFGKFDKGLLGGSGTYNSLEVIVKNNEGETSTVLITSTNRVNASLRNKVLVPNKLGIKGGDEYTSGDLVKTVEGTLKDIKVDDNIKTALIAILNDLLDKKGRTRGGSFVDAIRGSDGNIISSLDIESTVSDDTKDLIETLSSSDLNNILKDLGEIIQPLMIAQKYPKNIKISYPSESNAKLVDFNIINKPQTIEFSAKAGTGGVPSGKVWAERIENKMDSNSEEFETLSKKEYDFLKTLIESYKGHVGDQMITLIKKFIYKDKSKISKTAKDHLTNIGFANWTNWKDGVEKASKYIDANLKNRKQFEKFFTELYTGVGYDIRNLDHFKIEVLFDKWNKVNDPTKFGILIYPIYSSLVQVLNDDYKDTITNIIRQVSLIYQGHLYYKNGTFTLKINAGQMASYEFSPGGISTTNIFNAKLGIKMKH
jgi:hypothetical protein